MEQSSRLISLSKANSSSSTSLKKYQIQYKSRPSQEEDSPLPKLESPHPKSPEQLPNTQIKAKKNDDGDNTKEFLKL